MKQCNRFQKLFTDAFYDELEKKDQQQFEEHISSCPKCKVEYEKIKSTLKNMDTYSRPEPDQRFWDNYWENLESRLESKSTSKITLLEWLRKLFKDFKIEPVWIYATATAAAFLLIGIFIGKFYFTSDVVEVGQPSTMSAKTIRTVASAENYLQKSQVLLLGIVNMDTDTDSQFKPSILKQQQISRDLIQQTAVLKEDLQDANQKFLLELVSELETILLQIANLEKEHDLKAIELIQQSLERKGILIKINLGEILSTSRQYENENRNIKKLNKKQI